MKRILSIALFTLLAACAGNLSKPETFTEQVAYVEAGAQGAIKTLADLTCKQYTKAGACTDGARPLHPARSQGYLDTLSKVRLATRAAATMAPAGGACLGQPSTPLSCLALATTMLGEVQKIITDLRR